MAARSQLPRTAFGRTIADACELPVLILSDLGDRRFAASMRGSVEESVVSTAHQLREIPAYIRCHSLCRDNNEHQHWGPDRQYYCIIIHQMYLNLSKAEARRWDVSYPNAFGEVSPRHCVSQDQLWICEAWVTKYGSLVMMFKTRRSPRRQQTNSGHHRIREANGTE